jgi:hypothetical protein
MRSLRGWLLLLPFVVALAASCGDSAETVLMAESVEQALALASENDALIVVKFWFDG